ncbi:MAG TPA: hypothetical protein VGE74_10015 [Gemmata sp.]
MATVRTYSLNPLRPAYNAAGAEAAVRPVALPVGGPLGTGGPIPKGTVLGHIGGTARNEVWTLTINSGTGTVTFTFTAHRPYQTTFAVDAPLATVRTQLETIFGTGNIAVTGTPGTSYTLTFQNHLSNRLMGGLVAVSTSGGSGIALTRDTTGSCGAGQFGVYNNSNPGTARCVLKYDYTTSPDGSRVTEHGPTGQPAEASAYFSGHFFAADLVGLDANAVSDPGWRLVEGNAITDAGAVVGIGV